MFIPLFFPQFPYILCTFLYACIREKIDLPRAVESGGPGCAIAPPIFRDMRKKVAFSTPNISTLQE